MHARACRHLNVATGGSVTVVGIVCVITQLNEHVRTQVLTPQCLHLFNTTTCETTHFLVHVLIYLQFRSGRLCIIQDILVHPKLV